jgi:hypothetical protein
MDTILLLFNQIIIASTNVFKPKIGLQFVNFYSVECCNRGDELLHKAG